MGYLTTYLCSQIPHDQINVHISQICSQIPHDQINVHISQICTVKYTMIKLMYM
jgi:hypothetical protein